MIIGICASGPSLTQQDVDTLRAKVDRLIVINTTFRLAPNADHLYACDGKWWQHYHADIMKSFTGMCWAYDQCATKLPRVLHLPGENKPGLCRQPWRTHTGGNSGHQAINLAYHLGATRLILLGYDMKGDTHWHGDHPTGLNNSHGNYPDWRQRMKPLADDLAAEGVEVLNATRDTALECFDRIQLEDV